MTTEELIEIEKKLTELEGISNAALAIGISLLTILVGLLLLWLITNETDRRR